MHATGVCGVLQRVAVEQHQIGRLADLDAAM